MTHDPLAPSGWYPDGAAPELRPAPAPGPSVPASTFGQVPTSTFGGAPSTFGQASTFGQVPARLGDSLNLADTVSQGAAYQLNRLDEARAVRRTAFWFLGFALGVLALSGLVSVWMRSVVNTFSVLLVLAAVALASRAVRDYRRALFRGAPALGPGGWLVVVVAFLVALVPVVAGPVAAARDLEQRLQEESTAVY
ncbi:hypothetical protein GXP71_15090 [Cellulomonas sp. H30R-01]|uniref:hypothetical protein n=1 Tax=Cellulomonas sp. H30R-01 TaxID=2704467 RepID=UPI00138D5BAD|nr:hypothetical protein [Cellulomonas sp. H30R-01]QHT57269.1 hypothetical protein GXP71_15090 [Cellulomonas sp. H30R-01]